MIAPDSHPVRTPLGHLITMCGDRRGKHMALTRYAIRWGRPPKMEHSQL